MRRGERHLPRFLDIGDRSRLFVALDNVEGPAGEYVATISPSGPVLVGAQALRTTLKLAAQGQGRFAVPLTAAGPGTARSTSRSRGRACSRRCRAASASASHPARGAAAALGADPRSRRKPAGLGRPHGGCNSRHGQRFALRLDPPGIDVPVLLQALDRYPYGCSEQIVRGLAAPLREPARLVDRMALDPTVDGGCARPSSGCCRVRTRAAISGSGRRTGRTISGSTLMSATPHRARERKFAVPQGPFALASTGCATRSPMRARCATGGGPRLCRLCARAQRTPGNGRPALPRRFAPLRFSDAPRARTARRRPGPAGRPRPAQGDGFGRSALSPSGSGRLPCRLRLPPARRRWADSRSPPRPGCGSALAPQARSRPGTGGWAPDQHPGECWMRCCRASLADEQRLVPSTLDGAARREPCPHLPGG